MLRIILTFIVLLASFSTIGYSQQSDADQAARTYLNSGNPELAIRTAQRVLKNITPESSDRLSLLNVIAQAEILITTHQHYNDINPAIHAIDAVLLEFPNTPKAAEFRWQLAWMHWKAGDYQEAIAAVRNIITQDQQAANLRRAWLLMARIHIQLGGFSYARSDLLQYGIQVDNRSKEQAIGMAWMAIIDIGESRRKFALKSFNTVYKRWPDVLRSNAQLFAAYIDLMHQLGNTKTTFQLSELFIRQYIDSPHAASVRLIHADIQAMHENNADDAIKEYGILADKQAETLIGRQAFMRKMMLEFRHNTDRATLIPAMMALKKIATNNQLSIIEDEAMLDLARLWVRLQQPISSANQATPASQTDRASQNNPKQRSLSKSPALQAYAHAATSLQNSIAQTAAKEGSAWMGKSITRALDSNQWVKAVSVWRQFPQLRPGKKQSQTLRLGIAHAMRMLMLFDPAEHLLQTLYNENKFSIRGERTMLELAKLWHDRQDPSGVKKILRWLNRHEFSMYRPDMLLIVARMQLDQKQAEQARQTLSSVRANDITDTSQASYWQTKAAVSEALSQWHSAARAWAKYRKSKNTDAKKGLRNHADALFAANEFAQALQLYLSFAVENQGAAWAYHVGICQIRTGEITQGTTRLQKLAGSTNSDQFAALAKLALADQQAGILLGETP